MLVCVHRPLERIITRSDLMAVLQAIILERRLIFYLVGAGATFQVGGPASVSVLSPTSLPSVPRPSGHLEFSSGHAANKFATGFGAVESSFTDCLAPSVASGSL